MIEGADYYNGLYRNEMANSQQVQAYTDARIAPAIAHVRGESVLDLGCGLGMAANLIDDREYLGLDFSPVAIEYAKAHNENPNAAFDVAHFEEAPDRKYDSILLLEVLEHIEQPGQLASLALAKAQKRIIITVPINMPCRGHAKSAWTKEDLEELFGELAHCQAVQNTWLLAVKHVNARPLVSVCMIARNEEDIIGTAIASTAGLADEIIVLDTGSSDGTMAAAVCHGARVLVGGDRMNKGAARNQASAAADGDWAVVLDCDEQIADPVGLRKFLETTDAGAAYIRLAYMNGNTSTLEYPQMRCWRKGLIEYRYRAHEVPIPPNGKWPKVAHTDFVWEHRPPAGRTWKSQYTLDRLLLDIEEHPGAARPMYYLGRQYMYRSEWELAIEWLEKYLAAQDETNRADAWSCIAKCHSGLGDKRKQIQALHMACAEMPERRDWWCALAELYHAEGKDHIAAGLLKCALEQPRSAKSYHTAYWFGPHIHDLLARCLWKLARYEEGGDHAKRACELEPESQRLKDNLAFFERRLCQS